MEVNEESNTFISLYSKDKYIMSIDELTKKYTNNSLI